MGTGPAVREEGVRQGRLGSQARPGVELEHFLDEIFSLWVKVSLVQDITKRPGRKECKISAEHRGLLWPLLRTRNKDLNMFLIKMDFNKILRLAWCDGVPRYWKILASWSVSLLPGKSGFLVMISARMQPQLQRSTGVAYEVTRRTSGARYHCVTTWQ